MWFNQKVKYNGKGGKNQEKKRGEANRIILIAMEIIVCGVVEIINAIM
jgi:hypothetical protein